MIKDIKDTKTLALQATHCLLLQQSVTVEHLTGWKREGFPLPIKRKQPNANGVIIQEYRPMAILEYVQELLSGEIARKAAESRKAEKQELANAAVKTAEVKP